MMATNVKQLNDAERINIDRCIVESDRQQTISRRQQALLAAAAEDGTGRLWAIVRVAKQHDNDVDKSLSAALIDHWLPLKKAEQTYRGGRAGAPKEALWALAWPGYIFVRVVDKAEAWAGIRSIKHVVSVLGVGERPFFTDDAMLLKIKAKLATMREHIGKPMQAGDTVRIDDGPLARHSGRLVKSVDTDATADARAVVEVTLFGRAVITEISLAKLSFRA